jgi:hypothetical protein
VFVMEGRLGMTEVRPGAQRHHGLYEVTFGRSPATTAIPAAVAPLEGGALGDGVDRHGRLCVRRRVHVDSTGRLATAVDCQARYSPRRFFIATLRRCGRGGLISEHIGQNRR